MRGREVAGGGDLERHGEHHTPCFATFLPLQSTPMPRYFPNLDEFHAIARSADLVPVYRQLLADHLTPVTAFELLGKQEHALLLESVVGNEKIGRYSFIASGPKLTYQVKDGRAAIRQHGNSKQAATEFATNDPLADLAKLLPQRRYYKHKNLPAFTGGLVGYAGYDTIRYYEGEMLPRPPADDRNLPDLLMGLYDTLVIFDQVDKTIKVVANADLTQGDAQAAYRDACARIDALVTLLQQPPRSKLGEIDTQGAGKLQFTSNFTRQR